MKQKIVIKVQRWGSYRGCFCWCLRRKSDGGDQGFKTKVLKKVAETHGVISVALEGDAKDKVVVIGEGIDATKLIHCLRKKVGHATIESLQEVKEDKKEEEKKISYTMPICNPCTPSYFVTVYP